MAEEIQKRNVTDVEKEAYSDGVVLGVQNGKAVTYGVNEEGGLVTTDKVNENITFGEVKEGDTNVVSGGDVYKNQKNFLIHSKNLFDKENDTIEVGSINSNGLDDTTVNNFRVKKILKPNAKYTISHSLQSPSTSVKVLFFGAENNVIGSIPYNVLEFTTPSNLSYAYLQAGYLLEANKKPLRNNEAVNIFMINEGGKVNEYESFGIKNIKSDKIEDYPKVLELIKKEILVRVPKKNLIDVSKTDFSKRYSPGDKNIVNSTGAKYVLSAFVPVELGNWYVINCSEDVPTGMSYTGGYFKNNEVNTAIDNITFIDTVDGKGKCFQVPNNSDIKGIYINLIRTDTTGSTLIGDFQLELGEQATEIEPYQLIEVFNPKYEQDKTEVIVEKGKLEDVTNYNSLKYQGISKYFPKFNKDYILKNRDLCVVTTGTSLTARSIEHCTEHIDAKFRPPLMHSNNLASIIWDALKWEGQEYRRYDSGYFTENGNFQTQSNVNEWDDGAYRSGLTRFSNNGGSVSFKALKDAWQFNFIYRSDSVSTTSATITITEGNGKIEVFNGTIWVEANGYVFSQREVVNNVGDYTIIDPITNTSKILTNYKTSGNTTYQKRLKMRCIDRSTDKNITISASADRFNYWGVEWSNREFMITYINASRGSHSSYLGSSLDLAHFQDNEVWSFKPDLIFAEDPIHNAGASGVLNPNYPSTYYGQATQNFFFENNGLSMSNRCTALALPVPEFVLFNSSISWNFGGINDNGTLKISKTKDNLMWTALDTQMSCYLSVLEKQSNILYINAVKNWVDSAIQVYGNMRVATEGSGKNGKTFTNEGSHWNDTGSKVMARILKPIFNFEL